MRWALIELLEGMLAKSVSPLVPAQGSVGASGDLAPLAHQRESEILQRRGGQWLSAAPAVQWRYQTDAQNNRNNPATAGLRENEVGVELPLWRWGQRDAAQAEGEKAQAYAQQYRQWQAWQVAGEVRDLFFQPLAEEARGASVVVESAKIAQSAAWAIVVAMRGKRCRQAGAMGGIEVVVAG